MKRAVLFLLLALLALGLVPVVAVAHCPGSPGTHFPSSGVHCDSSGGEMRAWVNVVGNCVGATTLDGPTTSCNP